MSILLYGLDVSLLILLNETIFAQPVAQIIAKIIAQKSCEIYFTPFFAQIIAQICTEVLYSTYHCDELRAHPLTPDKISAAGCVMYIVHAVAYSGSHFDVASKER